MDDKTKNMNEKEKKAIQLGLMDGRLRELEQQFALVEKQINELQLCSFALDEIKEAKPGSEMLSPISPGVFLKTELKNNNEIIINVGAKIFCKKNIEEAKEFIERKLDKTLEVYNKLASEINLIAENIMTLEKEIREKE
ncbi:MAG: prefoldin subunit alpha [Candidatus Nanoarchaeia archaeon]